MSACEHATVWIGQLHDAERVHFSVRWCVICGALARYRRDAKPGDDPEWSLPATDTAEGQSRLRREGLKQARRLIDNEIVKARGGKA